MAEPVYKVYLRNRNRSRVVEIDDYLSVDIALNFNQASRWQITLAVPSPAADVLDFGYGLVVTRDNLPIVSGDVSEIERRWPDQQVVVAGYDDTVWLDRRIALAVPSGPPYTAAAYDVHTGAAETVLYQFVNVNMGPGARSDRVLPGLTLAADLGRGITGTWQGRFEAVGTLLREIATAASLGFRIVQVGSDVQFQVFAPVDRTQSAIFSPEMGNMQNYVYRVLMPEANYVVEGGANEGTARIFVEGGDSASMITYGRVEQFQDARDLSAVGDLTQRLTKDLIDKADTTDLRMVPIDTAGLTFGTHYGLGDIVTVMIDNVPVQDVVRGVHMVLSADGAVVQPIIGMEATSRMTGIFTALRTLQTRISRLERR